MSVKLTYSIKFVDNMENAIRFYRDTVGLTLKFESPYWSEFSTGETTLALHPASDVNPAGSVHLGFSVPDIDQFHTELSAKSVVFTADPAPVHGTILAEFVDSEGARCSVSQSKTPDPSTANAPPGM